jgi:anti-sigma-K factor RskA
MRDETTPRLATAFLALSDGEEPEPPRRSALAALAMVVVIALATPLAWLSAPAGKPSSVPLATPASKAALAAPGDDGPDS